MAIVCRIVSCCKSEHSLPRAYIANLSRAASVTRLNYVNEGFTYSHDGQTLGPFRRFPAYSVLLDISSHRKQATRIRGAFAGHGERAATNFQPQPRLVDSTSSKSVSFSDCQQIPRRPRRASPEKATQLCTTLVIPELLLASIPFE